MDCDFEKNKKQLSNIKEDLFQLKDSINSFSDAERDLSITYHTNVIKRIEEIKSEVEKNFSLKNEIKEESSKDLLKFNKSKEAIVKTLVDINANAKDRSDVIMNVSRLLNDQIIVDEISSYLENKINSLTSSVNFNKNQVKMPLKMEDLSMKMDLINDHFLNRFNNEKQLTNLIITPTVSLSIANQRNKTLVHENETKLVPKIISDDSMMLDDFSVIVNNFDKMKNVQPKKKKKNKAKNSDFYSQFYY
jgi:hypothetical protein